VQTKEHDKLGAGVTQESNKVPWYEFPMGGQGPSKHREGKADRDEGLGGGPGREHVSNSMSAASGQDRRRDLTS
jgi:hypothetical protein